MQEEMPRFTVLQCKRCKGKVGLKVDEVMARQLFSLTNNLCIGCYSKERSEEPDEVYRSYLRLSQMQEKDSV
jgi:hypothetical protein